MYLTVTELFPVDSLANISLISLERLHATLFLFRHCLVGKRDYLIIILCSWLFSLTLSSVIAPLYLRLSLANPYVNASHTFLTLVVVTVSYVIIISTVKNNPPSAIKCWTNSFNREETNGDFIYSYCGLFSNHFSSHYLAYYPTPYVK